MSLKPYRWAGLLAAAVISVSVASAQETAPPVSKPAIPFKTEPSPIEEHGPRLVLALTAFVALSVLVLYVVRKRLPNLPTLAAGGKRLRVVDRVRLNPRCTLFVVRLDEREILIGQCGDTLVQLDPQPISEKGA